MEHEPKFIQIYRAMYVLLTEEVKAYHKRKIERELKILLKDELNMYDNRME